MNRVLWIAQILLALMFLAAGATKLFATGAALAEMYLPAPPFMRVIAVFELLGAVGLVLPGLLKLRPALTPLAAAGLFVIMAGAVVTTVMKDEVSTVALPLILALLAAFVAYGRWRLSPLPGRDATPVGPAAGSPVSNQA